MGRLPGLFAAPRWRCYYICFSCRRVTCTSQLTSGPCIESWGPGLVTLWIRGALGLVIVFFPIGQALGMDGVNGLLGSRLWNSGLPASCFLPPNPYSRFLGQPVGSYPWVRLFIQ